MANQKGVAASTVITLIVVGLVAMYAYYSFSFKSGPITSATFETTTTTTIERDETAYNELDWLELEIDNLLHGENWIDLNHMIRMEEDLDALKDKVDAEDWDRVKAKLAEMEPFVAGRPSADLDIDDYTTTTMPITGIGDSDLPVPECSDQLLTVPPVEMDEINSIIPLGSINPPGHTLPTEHMYLNIGYSGITTDTTPLRAPADVYIETISDAIVGEERTEYVIMFALCKDVRGYYDHVKELSDEILSLFENAECLSWSVHEDNYCTKEINHWVDAGEVIGGVGHLQGNFDLGVYDLSKTSAFANVSRYSSRTPYIQCPLDYYDEPIRSQLYNKILDRTVEPLCG
ncbi:MAG: hypothetical protein ACYTFW_20165, partial [Planctomycetota bacterium]